jgi:hypothetical protein
MGSMDKTEFGKGYKKIAVFRTTMLLSQTGNTIVLKQPILLIITGFLESVHHLGF